VARSGGFGYQRQDVSTHDIIVIGGSTGALDALKQIFADFPADLPAAVFVVRLIPSDGADVAADILNAAGPLAVKTAAEGDVIENSHAYIAPAGRHLLVDNGVIRLGNGPRENIVSGDMQNPSRGDIRNPSTPA
jgi:two-component system chemotaxis response regulator CheB